MQWQGRKQSDNVEDRWGMGVGGLGIVGTLIVVGISWLMGADPRQILQLISQTSQVQEPAAGPPQGAAADPQAQFISVVLADTEETWTQLFAEKRLRYEPPKLVLFTDEVQSACGLSSTAVGPFYCPNDRKVYIDLAFYRELDRRFGAPGDFAQAYVVAHEVGHHVQNLLGIMDKAGAGQSGATGANGVSVKLELQADCLAGVWGHHAQADRKLLDPGDVDEGLNAAAAIGDDTIQRRSQGRVTPESWTHGSSQQRVGWFKRGLTSGRIDSCDTFQG